MRNLAKGISLACILGSTALFGQSYTDVVRFSRQPDFGSARYMALGGAFSALGNDFSAVGVNPAGLAVYRKDELSMSTYYRNSATSTTYYGNTSNASDGQMRFNQFGLVFVANEERDFRFNFGLRYNRTNDYGFEQSISGMNTDGSILDLWWGNADYYSPNSDDLWGAGLIYEQLAADVGLLEYDPSVGWIENAWGYNVNQRQSYKSRGGKGVFGIDFGAMVNKELHIGASVEIPTVNYTTQEVFTESNYDAGSLYTGMEWINNNEITGAGFQLNVGVLWTPDNLGRFSAYFHSPTWWNMTQNGNTEVISHSSTGSANSYQPFSPFYYSMTTPLVVGAGYAYVFEKYGLISVDYSYQDLRTSQASSTDYPGELDYLNSDINSELQGLHDLRVGGELRLGNQFIRAGYHFTSSPFKSSNPSAYQYSLGWGYKANQWGVDITYSLRGRSDEQYLYSEYYVQSAERVTIDNIIVATMYFRM